MNKFFSRILLLGALVMMVMTTGCQKDGVVTLRAKINHFDRQGKVILGGDNHRTPYWRNGDKMIVNNNIITLSFNDPDNVPVEVPTASAYWAVFPAGIFSSASDVDNRININLPSLQPYVLDGQDQSLNAPMAAYLTSDNSPLTFSNLGAVLAIQIVNNTPHSTITVDSVTVEATGIPLCGEGYINNIESDSRHVVLTSTSEDDKKVVLAVENTDQTLNRRSVSMNLPVGGSAKTVYVYVPASLYTPNRYRITVHAVAGTEDVSVTHEQSESNPNAGSIPCNSLVDVRFEMGNVQFPTGAVHGYFSVSPTQQVYFSNGNLQYQPSTTTWRFAENQWDFIGEGSTNTLYPGTVEGSSNKKRSTSGYTGWIDLYGWGTSGYSTYSPINIGGLYTYPNVSDISETDYDWGYYNQINNGGNQNHMWRTLKKDEWIHILTQRCFTINGVEHFGNNYSYKYVTLNVTSDLSVPGLLVFPDGYTEQSNVSSPLDEIPAGCVFLPGRGGCQSGNTLVQPTYGWYWSSTKHQASTAYFVQILSSSQPINTSSSTNVGYGLAVRLVKDVE